MNRSFDGLPLTTFLGTSAVSSFGKRLDPHPLSKVSHLVAISPHHTPRLCKFAVPSLDSPTHFAYIGE